MASVSSAGLAAGMDIHPPGKSMGLTGLSLSAPPSADTEPSITTLSAEGRRQGAAAALADAAQQLLDPATWMATQAFSSRPDVLQAASSSKTPTGHYRVDVQTLASAQATSSATFSGLGTTIGLGTLNLEVGEWNGSMSAFVTNPNWPKANFTIGPKDNSLERVRDRINASGVGVLASVISDATGSRLVLRASATGTRNAFKVDASPDELKTNEFPSQTDLQALGFDPPVNPLGMTQISPAQDATVRINGQQLNSESNIVRQSETGLTLQLRSSSDTPVNVEVRPDHGAVLRSASELTLRYNEWASQSGPGVQPSADWVARLRIKLAHQGNEGSLSQPLRELGLSLDADGQLKLDTGKLAQAIDRDRDGTRQTLSRAFGMTNLDAQATSMSPSTAGTTARANDMAGSIAWSPLASRKLLQEYQSLGTEATLSNNA
jgi:flagellar hook-associated protein 2